ncbi:60S ribosomal subunit protein L6e, putative [Plasmodium knowlesi strain H]|uniref:60S ribosomal subunit protein L6e, putative n=3 Tax=Plasmodium knowlesi TaxID=5850 RepID=A0A5K1VIM4_PLAKH|nr:60S ribosomal protein L6, putative [Plasmodium knowlesi strain H]OTN66414.1 putative 60S ribosomal subunit protein L6e [Plasmodium knowlesi]CAA9989951.1 60S ribosomal protein L6, putative [Plasmodium knowlesi strain H]SBO24531.1 60S ribosomal subunit protein L6e, putative [Plasmodium knowlesi strain H]SBO26402.1 60S ribosomal subunit protein L6e, putative [Plasmodium knowlesi strain H]VVS79425.1 60S ribosomal protein L6, putative [Plasmodium knowlesi strain H]|eukprot:XP_002259966.1 60S ribosomal subunit protein L6e, putative [Plasmodium knowlesi strain H]
MKKMAKDNKVKAINAAGEETPKYYKVKGKKKILVPIKAKKTIAKKYYGRKLASKKKYMVQGKMRKSIEIGKVAIILSGRHMGKRCIITKILPSGLLAVVGPYEVNGVPLKRVNPRYVVVTSTNIFKFKNMEGLKDEFIKLAEQIQDSSFVKSLEIKKKQKKLLSKKNESLFMNDVIAKIKELMKEDPKMQKLQKIQKQIDTLLKDEITKDKIFAEYLKSKFTLRNDMALHKMKF